MENKKGDKELVFMLYNYPNIDKLIENRKLEIIDKVNTSYNEWSKAKHSLYTNTLEDIIERIDSDKTISRLNKWKNIIEKFLGGISYNDMIKRFVTNKYFFNGSTEEVMKTLKINYDEYYFLDQITKKSLYRLCEKEKLYV
ncbi:MAG: hypothetical protein IK997_07460 [Bacilli bacterium]|nr:hypothetical protein [Bacilli bacterium]